MKTTFKTVFSELDDKLMDIDIQDNYPEDIDIDKIKGEVFMQINGDKNSKKKLSKKVIVILAAAVILVGGTVGAFATGSIQSVFKGYFKGSDVNDLGLYDGGNVETQSDNYDVKLLGVISDGDIAYSAIEVTKKDGSTIVEDGYYVNSKLQTFDVNSVEFSFNGDEQSQNVNAVPRSICSLSDDKKTLSIYTDYVRGADMEHGLKDFRVSYHNKAVNIYKLDKVLYTRDLPTVQTGPDEMTDEEYRLEEEKIQSLREENGLTENECIWVQHEGKFVYAKGEQKQFELPFDISFDINRTVDNLISRDLNTENASNVVKDYTSNAKMTVSPLGISISGECDQKYDNQLQNSECCCFELPGRDGKSKIVLDDGTVYYLLSNEGGERRTDENGVFHETINLQYSATEQVPFNLANNRILIDLDKVQSVIINGDTVYKK